MGHLVALPAHRTPPRAVEPGHSAAILFFTGVRYVRVDALEAAPAVPSYATRRGRKRKAPPAELLA